ncbi:FtsB family cell division protein [Trueperella bialowiezensis]|nr:septum formation initiator family protein [Trueperella bialowiezensis]
MSSRRPTGRPGPERSGSRPRARKDSAAAAARRRDSAAPMRPQRADSGSQAAEQAPRKVTAANSQAANRAGTGGQRNQNSSGKSPRPVHNPRPPGQSRASRSKPSENSRPAATRRAPESSARGIERFNKKRHIRFTMGEKTRQFSLRGLAIVFFVLVAIAIVAPPMNRYLEQQQEKRQLTQQLEDATERVALLEQELARWQDDDFVRSQARERLGYVMPGETLYLVSDPDEGTHEQQLAERTKEMNDRRRQATPFYVTMWDSIVIAGGAGEETNPSNVPLIGQTPAEDTTSPGSSEPASDSPDGDTSGDEASDDAGDSDTSDGGAPDGDAE